MIEIDQNGTKKIKNLGRKGLTPPTEDVRNKYFKKLIPYSYEQVRKVEDEMLFRLNKMKEGRHR